MRLFFYFAILALFVLYLPAYAQKDDVFTIEYAVTEFSAPEPGETLITKFGNYKLKRIEPEEGKKGKAEIILLFKNKAVWSKSSEENIYKAGMCDVNNDTKAELVIEEFTGGAHCCYHITLMSLKPDGKVDILFDKDTQDADFMYCLQTIDLSESEYNEIVLPDSRFTYLKDLSYVASPVPFRIYKYLDGKYVSAGKDYPEVINKWLDDTFELFLEENDALSEGGAPKGNDSPGVDVDGSDQEWLKERVKGLSAELYIYALTIDEQKETLELIKEIVNEDIYKWLTEVTPEIDRMFKEDPL